MGARADQEAIGGRRDAAAAEPIQSRLLVVDRSSEALIAQKPHELGRDGHDPVPHPPEELRILRFGRQVHAEIDQRRPGRGTHTPVGRRTGRSPLHSPDAGFGAGHDRPMPDPRRDQPPPLRLHIAARHRREVETQEVRELALRRKPIRDPEAACHDVIRDGIGDGEVMRPAVAGEVGGPGFHASNPGRSDTLNPNIDLIALLIPSTLLLQISCEHRLCRDSNPWLKLDPRSSERLSTLEKY